MKKINEMIIQGLNYLFLYLIAYPLYRILGVLQSIKNKIDIKWIEVKELWKKQ
jgi:hypothetical protein